ncbi:MAG: ABC transporter substrate-binding protein [Thermomicrobiales bacterium]
MTARGSQRTPASHLSRRDALRLAGGAGAAAFLGAKGSRVAAAQDAPGAITIPDSAAALPTEDVTFRWIDSGDLKALFYTKFFEAYQQARPNITVQYDALPWEEIGRIVPLGVQNGDAHDVFAMPPDVPEAQAVKEGWVAPLDDIIPNFAEWKERFPFGSFLDGIHVFEGKTYTFPVTSSKRYWTMTFYNEAYLQEAGYDLASKPLTWEEFREAARKVTEQGQGEYFGLIFPGKAGGEDDFATFVRNMGRMAGAAASPDDIDWRTGEYVYTSDEYLAAIELLVALNDDGSIFPGALSLDTSQARALFPTGVAGMILQGPWNIPQWQREQPDFQFGLASQPVPNSGTQTPLTYEEQGSNQSWVFADSPYKAIAGDMFSYIGSVEGQVAVMAATFGNLRSIVPEAVAIAQDTVELDPLASTALSLWDEQIRLGPMVEVRNPEGAAQVALERKPLTPKFDDVVQGIFAGQLTDAKAAMQDLQDRSEAELERAIKAVQDKGVQVSRDDWVFPNWDPTKDYTEAEYTALSS